MPDFPQTGTPAAIWGYVTRTLTAFTGTPRTDLIGSNASIEASAGVRISRLDTIPAFIAPVESSILMDGLADLLFEIVDTKSSMIEAWLDLTPLQAGDTVVVQYSHKVKAAGLYSLYASETYSDVQALPLICILKKNVYRDTKVTAQQTAGINRTLDIQLVRAIER